MDLLPFLAISVLVAVLPGVDMAVVTQQVLARGHRAGLLAVAGIVTGSAVQAAAATAGLSALLAASAPAFAALKIVGSVYLGWLGARTLWRIRHGAPQDAGPSRGTGSRSFRTGLLTNLLNPKIIVFYVAFLPQFVVPGPGAPGRTALLAAVFLVVATAWLLIFIALLDRLRPLLVRAAVRRRMEQVTGLVLIGLGVRLAAEA